MLVFMKNRLFSKNFFLVAVLVCVSILNFYPQKNYNAVMNPSKAIASTTDDVAEQVLVKSADDVAGRAVVSSADDIVGRTVASSTDDIAVSATAGSRQAEKQLLSGSEWNEYFQQTYGAENVQWATKGKSGLTKGVGKSNIDVSPSRTVNTENPLANIKYTDKVKVQATQADYHGFPESVDGFGAYGKVTSITGGDKIVRTKVEIPGNYMGKDGVFQYIIEPDGVTSNHRLFVPNK